MKKFVIFAMNLLLVIALLGCGTKSSESESDFKYEIDKDKIADIEKKFRTDDRIVKFLTIRLDPVIDDRVAEFSDNTNSIKILRGNIISYVDGLKQRVQEKLINEYNDFISELKNENPQVILERAYEKVCKNIRRLS